ncbi:hypothetical protein THAOC_08911, partial [Thalassiosira oceanica]
MSEDASAFANPSSCLLSPLLSFSGLLAVGPWASGRASKIATTGWEATFRNRRPLTRKPKEERRAGRAGQGAGDHRSPPPLGAPPTLGHLEFRTYVLARCTGFSLSPFASHIETSSAAVSRAVHQR